MKQKSLAAILVLTLVTTLGTLATPALGATAPKVGASCTKKGVERVYKSKKFICVKSGKKLVWSIAKAAASAPTPTPIPTTSSPTANTIWDKYGFTKPSKVEDVISAATSAFAKYTENVRMNYTVKVVAQSDVDPVLVSWVQDGANFVAKRFAYPAPTREFVNVIASDVAWLQEAYTKAGYTANEVRDRIGGFNAGAPAFGGSNTNTWNYATIKRDNMMVRDRGGMAQTAGHEYFHAIQEILAKGNNPGAKGENIPNWYWEGPAMFIGFQTATKIGIIDYKAQGRDVMISRYQNGAAINRTSALNEIRANDGVTDPYAIGMAASEFLVSLVGMEKMIAVYEALGSTKDFPTAFKTGTGVELADFESLFEEVRANLGFPRS